EGCKTLLANALEEDSYSDLPVMWMGYMFGYFSPSKQKQYGSLATVLSKSSVEGLGNCELTPAARKEAIDRLHDHRAAYVELPAGAFPLADGSIYVKAIVALAINVHFLPSCAFALVVSVPESGTHTGRADRCLAWREIDKVGFTYSLPELSCQNGELSDYFSDSEGLFKPLEDFLLSTLLYVAEVKEDPEAGIVDVPRKNDRAS